MSYSGGCAGPTWHQGVLASAVIGGVLGGVSGGAGAVAGRYLGRYVGSASRYMSARHVVASTVRSQTRMIRRNPYGMAAQHLTTRQFNRFRASSRVRAALYGHIVHDAVRDHLRARDYTYHPNRGLDFVHNTRGFQFEVTTRRQLAAHRTRYYWMSRWSFITYRRR